MLKTCFSEHRDKLLAQMEENSLLLSFSRRGGETISNERYNVNRNYFYLSGVLEYDNIVVLLKQKDGKENQIIFINPYDEMKAKWVGAPYSKEVIKDKSGIFDVRYLDTFDSFLESMLNIVKTVYLDYEPNGLKELPNPTEKLGADILAKKPWIKICNARPLFAEARMVKHPEEIEEISKAIEITKHGIWAILKNMQEGYEYQVESFFDQAIKYHGATGYAFTTIAAGGKNSTCLHYCDNDSLVKNGDLLLFDLGASLNMYCADISRTFPVSGKFTERQKQLYNIVLGAQEKVLKAAKPGLSIRDLQAIVIKHYQEELLKIGLIQNKEEVSKYYYHGVSHHLGLDCHDLSDHFAPLKAGNVITNEPGLYIAEEEIGIRIEDDILITEDGAICLSKDILKTVEDIEAFMAK